MMQTVENTERPRRSHPLNLELTAHRVCSGLSLIFIGLVLAESVGAWRVPGPGRWPESGLVLVVTVSTLLSLSRRLPGQNVLLAVAIIAAIGGLAQSIGVLTAFPFGPFVYTPAAGPRLLEMLPWWLPLMWVVVVLNSRGVARLMLRPWRKTRAYGFRLIGLTAVLCVLFDAAWEPFAGKVMGYWLWRPTRLNLSWYGAPVSNFAGWVVTVLLILVFATPVLINKSPVKYPPDYHPLILWCLLNLLFVTGAIAHQLWLAAVFNSVLVMATLIFAVRGARW
jgi:uncharacterized membrane protein